MRAGRPVQCLLPVARRDSKRSRLHVGDALITGAVLWSLRHRLRAIRPPYRLPSNAPTQGYRPQEKIFSLELLILSALTSST